MRTTMMAALAATMVAGTAESAVIYDFNGFSGSFSYTSSDFVSDDVTVSAAAANCSSAQSAFPCLGIEFRNGAQFDTLLFSSASPLGRQTTIYAFEANAFNSVGTFFDETGATLRVSLAGGNVPEPATWTMMIVGFGMVGGAMRSRKVAVSFA